MQPFRAPRPVQDKSRLELGMGIIDKGMPGSKDKDKDKERQGQGSDSEEPTELGIIWERSDMPVDKVG